MMYTQFTVLNNISVYTKILLSNKTHFVLVLCMYIIITQCVLSKIDVSDKDKG